MIRLTGISLPLDYNDTTMLSEAAKALRVRTSDIRSVSLSKRSVDARKKQNIHFEASLDIKLSGSEEKAAAKCSKARIIEEYRYELPECKKLSRRPVIIGSGPCGMLAGLILAQAGQRPIIIERGRDVDSRTRDVELFWSGSELDEISNVQFGEGGAGTFSDGKLNTGTKDIRIRKVLEEFANHGAPEEILWQAKPHIGTDRLKTTVRNIRQSIISLGGEYRFETKLTGLCFSDGRLTGAVICKGDNTEVIETDDLILAVGHSARDTFEMLASMGIPMEQKAFSVGVRIEHLQESINRQQYGSFADSRYLSAADYKLAVHLKNGRGVYTFCMCPGGSVVAAASERGRLVTNGMSEFARDKTNANSAVLVSVLPEDFGSDNALAGISLQRSLEEAAFAAGGGNYHAPVQRVEDFRNRIKTTSLGSVIPSYRPGFELTSLDLCLPGFISDSLREGLGLMRASMSAFSDGDAVLTGTESRSSSPVRIIRNEYMQSPAVRGFYPCGEGAGYAGGITSAAVDGIKAAEMILKRTDR